MAYLRKLKSGKWQVLIRKANQPHIIKSFFDKGTASKFARETETLMDKGIFEDYHCARSTTVGDLLIKYKDVKTAFKKGARQETCRVRKLINNPISKISLINLRSSHIYSLKKELKDLGLAPSSINKYTNILSNAWNVARKEWGIILPPQNPFDLVALEKVNDVRTRILTSEEYRVLLEKARLAPLHMLEDLIKFAYLTGARYGEITRLKRKNVDLNNKTCIFRDTKNSEDRTIPLSNEVIKILKRYPFGEIVFEVKRERFRKVFNTARKRANLENFRFHDLRACFCTNALLSGMSIAEVSSISGHKDWSQLKRYTRIKPRDLLEKINNVVPI